MNTTRERVMELLRYEAESGEFFWRQNRIKVRAGDLAGKIDSDGYRVIGLDRRYYKAHRLAWLVETGNWPSHEIDHINGKRLDNRISNLRDVPRRANSHNRHAAIAGTASGLLGVTWHKPRSTWRACIRVNGRVTFLGYFKTAEEGHQAYLAAKAIHHDVPGAKLVRKDRLTIR